MRRALLAALVLAAGAAAAQSRVNKLGAMLAEGFADQGFWRLATGPVKVAPTKDGGTVTAKQKFQARLSRIDLEATKCEDLFPAGAQQLVLTVHGIGGAGEEWEPALGNLAANNTPLLMYRWLPTGSREGIASSLADGINRLQECLAGNSRRLLVFGHSAGGVLGATAAASVKPDDDSIADSIAIVTVAAPLGGMGMKDKAKRGWTTFVEELGTDLRSYKAAAPGVRVLHVRTHPQADSYALNSSPVGHEEGWPVPGVPGARAVDLDETVNHEQAIAFAAAALKQDLWKLWAPAGTPVPPPAPTPAQPEPAPKPEQKPTRPIPTAPPGQPVRL